MNMKFVLACNCTLDRLSEIEINGSSPSELEKQAAFAHHSDRSVQS